MKGIMMLTLVICFTVPSTALSRTWYITPEGTGDALTIQAGIDSAAVGDTVLVTGGTYTGEGNKNLDFGGTDLVLLSEAGPELTIIDCEGSGRAVYFQSGETGAAVIEGFTITNGNTYWYGGGMSCANSSPTVRSCTFIGNSAGSGGGGMYCQGSSPTVINCTFSGNWGDMYGGAVFCWSFSYPTVINCTFSGNSAPDGGGMGFTGYSHPLIENTIITYSPLGEAIWCEPGSGATLTCCDVYGNTGGDWVGCIADQVGVNGNFSADPRFCAPTSADFSIDETSPCAPDNSPPSCGLVGAEPVGCAYAGVPTRDTSLTTWGTIKSMHR